MPCMRQRKGDQAGNKGRPEGEPPRRGQRSSGPADGIPEAGGTAADSTARTYGHGERGYQHRGPRGNSPRRAGVNGRSAGLSHLARYGNQGRRRRRRLPCLPGVRDAADTGLDRGIVGAGKYRPGPGQLRRFHPPADYDQPPCGTHHGIVGSRLRQGPVRHATKLEAVVAGITSAIGVIAPRPDPRRQLRPARLGRRHSHPHFAPLV